MRTTTYIILFMLSCCICGHAASVEKDVLVDEEVSEGTLVISFYDKDKNQGHGYVINGKRVELDRLKVLLTRLHAFGEEIPILIKVDKNRSVKHVSELTGLVSEVGFMNISLRTMGKLEVTELSKDEKDKYVKTIDILVPQLGHKEHKKRQEAEAELSGMPLDAVSILSEHLEKTDDPEIRIRLEQAIGVIQAKDVPSKPLLQADTVRARHILIMTNKIGANAAKAKAEEIRKQILKGADFADMAKEHSDCPSSKQGGDLGAFKKGMMVPAFEKAAFNQKVNVIGSVVETKYGYHIVQVLERN